MDSGQGDDHSIAYRIWVGTIVTIVPATFGVVLRFLGRHVSRAGFWWDDYTIAIALVGCAVDDCSALLMCLPQVFNWAMAILRWVQVIYWGFGRHVNFLSEEDVHSYQTVRILGSLAQIHILQKMLTGTVNRASSESKSYTSPTPYSPSPHSCCSTNGSLG